MTDPVDRDDAAFAESLQQAYRQTRLPGPGVRERSIAAIVSQSLRHARTGPGSWLEPTLTLRPIVAMAAAIALVAAGTLLAHRLDGRARRSDGLTLFPALAAGTRPVRFVFVDGSASRVTLVGDFNGWEAAAAPLSREPSGGAWSITVPLSPGWHSYAFVVNGAEWVPDPQAPLAPADGFATPRSVVVVAEQGT